MGALAALPAQLGSAVGMGQHRRAAPIGQLRGQTVVIGVGMGDDDLLQVPHTVTQREQPRLQLSPGF